GGRQAEPPAGAGEVEQERQHAEGRRPQVRVGRGAPRLAAVRDDDCGAGLAAGADGEKRRGVGALHGAGDATGRPGRAGGGRHLRAFAARDGTVRRNSCDTPHDESELRYSRGVVMGGVVTGAAAMQAVAAEHDVLERHLHGVPGWLSDEEATALYELAKACTGRGVIVEIGSFKGRSTICLGLGSQAGRGVPIYAIDPGHGWKRFAEFQANIRRAGIEALVT